MRGSFFAEIFGLTGKPALATSRRCRSTNASRSISPTSRSDGVGPCQRGGVRADLDRRQAEGDPVRQRAGPPHRRPPGRARVLLRGPLRPPAGSHDGARDEELRDGQEAQSDGDPDRRPALRRDRRRRTSLHEVAAHRPPGARRRDVRQRLPHYAAVLAEPRLDPHRPVRLAATASSTTSGARRRAIGWPTTTWRCSASATRPRTSASGTWATTPARVRATTTG